MQNISPYLINSEKQLTAADRSVLDRANAGGHCYELVQSVDACWLVRYWKSGGRIGFRLCYVPGGNFSVKIESNSDGWQLWVDALLGQYQVSVNISPVLRITTVLQPAAPLIFPYWPRDIMPLGPGDLWVQQTGTRSGQLYFTCNGQGAVFYLQNLTALSAFNEVTETSAGDTVGGDWPEIGFSLPVITKPLPAGESFVVSDAFIAFADAIPQHEAGRCRQFLDLMAEVYLALPKPVTKYRDWPQVLKTGLRDLLHSPGCWSQLDGQHYFNAYVSDYATPPEIMVQLAVLLPLLDYVEWSGKSLEAIERIKSGLPSFFDARYGTVMRWHPKAADRLQGEEEQKHPLVMDSWYLHHPLLNLSRLALKGDNAAEHLFMDSLPYAIKVAHHFKYEWPVFYRLDTLEVVKAETRPGKGGEKDVPGLYAHVMLQAWELTGDRKYLAESERSALKLQGLGFNLFYQANNTSFAAGALLRLYKVTKKEIYRDLSYGCLANVLKNVRLWDCNYGYGKHFPSFFALFPLGDAPYTAVYEEQETFTAIHDYLRHAEFCDILPSLRLLLAEYIRFLVNRAMFYYPPMLPKEMLQVKPKIGEVDPNLWIALEDLHDGWEKSGQVGQEVYGAGNAFGIVPRHYMQVPDADLMVFTDYPTYGFAAIKTRPVEFKLAGDARLSCRVMVVKASKKKLPHIHLTADGETVTGKKAAAGFLEFEVKGNSKLIINMK